MTINSVRATARHWKFWLKTKAQRIAAFMVFADGNNGSVWRIALASRNYGRAKHCQHAYRIGRRSASTSNDQTCKARWGCFIIGSFAMLVFPLLLSVPF
jgi:hypothetical protein